MPNWCDNSLSLTASKEKIDAVIKVLENRDGEKGLLSYLYPEPNYDDPNLVIAPAFMSEATPEFRMPDWWDWRVTNWGTKWDIEVRDFHRIGDDTVVVYFDSAWSPPTGVYDHIADEYEVTAYYSELGCGFCGKYTSADGDEQYAVDLDDLKSIKRVPADIEQFADLIRQHEDYMENL